MYGFFGFLERPCSSASLRQVAISKRSGHKARLCGRLVARNDGWPMKVRASVRRICDKCKLIKRKGVVRVICEDPRHKQRQG